MLYEGIDIATSQKSESLTIPAPVGGLNGRDPLANMDPADAYELDNVYPGTNSCSVRLGCTIHQDLASPVYSLDTFSDGNGDQLLATTGNGKMTNISTPGAPVEIKNGINGKETISTMFATVADHAQWMITVLEGTDVPFSYNGAATANLAITGLNEAASLLNYVCSYKSRLYWATKGKMGFYYLAPGTIQGAASWFDLGQISHLGGYIQAIATYSEDAGDGPDDYIVFITNRGECIMYNGTDPGNAINWQLVGRYRVAAPIGRRCVLDFAGDPIIMTMYGAVKFSKVRQVADTEQINTPLTSKLGDKLTRLNQYYSTYGWSLSMYSKGGWIILTAASTVNVDSEYHHFIMNTTTGSWTRFRSPEWNGLCWATFNRNLFFGRFDGTVRQADNGNYDNGKPIPWQAKQAYNYMGTPKYKHFKWAQFLVKSEAPAYIVAQLSVDYKEDRPVQIGSSLDPGPGASWDITLWDTDYWAPGPYTQRFIQPFGNYGVAASHWIQGQLQGATLEWFATEHVFEKAQGLLG